MISLVRCLKNVENGKSQEHYLTSKIFKLICSRDEECFTVAEENKRKICILPVDKLKIKVALECDEITDDQLLPKEGFNKILCNYNVNEFLKDLLDETVGGGCFCLHNSKLTKKNKHLESENSKLTIIITNPLLLEREREQWK